MPEPQPPTGAQGHSPESSETQPSGRRKKGTGGESQAAFRSVQKTRARVGLLVVAAGDVAIAVAAIWGVVKVSSNSGVEGSAVVAILTSAFTAIGTMTAAYFGIKSMSNTAQSVTAPTTDAPSAQTKNQNSGDRGSLINILAAWVCARRAYYIYY